MGSHPPFVRRRRLGAVWLAGLAACLVGCSSGVADLAGRPCDEGECLADYVCHPLDEICVATVVVGCNDDGLCPTDVTNSTPCDQPGSFIPCEVGAEGCSEGCRTCQADGYWSDCVFPDERCGAHSQCEPDQRCVDNICLPTCGGDGECEAGYHCPSGICVPYVVECGDSLVRGDEECDGAALDDQDCVSLGLGPGTLSCSLACTFDTSDCAPATCGNDSIDNGEECDGLDGGLVTCESLGYLPGLPDCTPSCRYDLESCIPETCGNDTINEPEECDGSDLGGATCGSLGYSPGVVQCTDGCVFDTSVCVEMSCGDEVKNGDDECDGDDFGDATCVSLGAGPGDLACTGGCELVLSGCSGCGNGTKEGDEWCDREDLGGVTCDGDLACSDECLLDANGCSLPSAGDGADGDLLIDNGTVNINSVSAPAFSVTAIATAGVTVSNDPSVLAPDDDVLLINLRGSTDNCGSAGNFELKRVASVNGYDIGFDSPIEGAYGREASNTDLTGQRVVLQRVPRYRRVVVGTGGVLTTGAWNGSRGGILAIRVAEELVVNAGGRIHVNGRGYRGGEGYTENHYKDGRQGESLCGNPQAESVLHNHGGGGGGNWTSTIYDDCGQGGGGAGHGTNGTWEDFTETCRDHNNDNPAHNYGHSYGSAELSTLLLGSGGGGGATEGHSNTSGSGGRGGGVILIYASRLVLEGEISARGGNGTSGTNLNDSGNGGGGSGGSIYLLAAKIEGGGTISAAGGNGRDSQTDWNSGGGDGASGRIRVDFRMVQGELYGGPGGRELLAAMATPTPEHIDLLLR